MSDELPQGWTNGQPVRAKDNSPPFQRWDCERRNRSSPGGTKDACGGETFSFAPDGAGGIWGRVNPAMNRWAIACKRNESRQGRKKPSSRSGAFFRPSGAWSFLHPQPTVEAVGYGRSSLTGLRNPCSSVSSVVKQKVVRRVKVLFALADQVWTPGRQLRGRTV